MRRPHERLELRLFTALQSEQPICQHARLVFHLDTEQFQHRKLAKIVRPLHRRLRSSIGKRTPALRNPTARPCQGRIPCVKLPLDFATVAGGSFKCCASNRTMPWTSLTGKPPRPPPQFTTSSRSNIPFSLFCASPSKRASDTHINSSPRIFTNPMTSPNRRCGSECTRRCSATS